MSKSVKVICHFLNSSQVNINYVSLTTYNTFAHITPIKYVSGILISISVYECISPKIHSYSVVVEVLSLNSIHRLPEQNENQWTWTGKMWLNFFTNLWVKLSMPFVLYEDSKTVLTVSIYDFGNNGTGILFS